MDILISDSLIPVPSYEKGEKISSPPIMAQATYVDNLNGLLDYGLTGMAFVHLYLCSLIVECPLHVIHMIPSIQATR